MSERLTTEQIYIQYKDKVTGYIRNKINNPSDVEELVSKVFMKVVEKYDTFDDSKASVSTWVYTITGNTVIDYYRVNRPHEEMDESFSYIESGFDDIFRQETLEELAVSLKKLDRRSRDIIILRYYFGLTLKDIALKMDMSYANVKIVHNKALLQLRQYMNY